MNGFGKLFDGNTKRDILKEVAKYLKFVNFMKTTQKAI